VAEDVHDTVDRGVGHFEEYDEKNESIRYATSAGANMTRINIPGIFIGAFFLVIGALCVKGAVDNYAAYRCFTDPSRTKDQHAACMAGRDDPVHALVDERPSNRRFTFFYPR
jgi:hypothetical protein